MLSLLALANKNVGDLTDNDIGQAAALIAGQSGQSDGLTSFFKILRDAEPNAKVTDLLSTPSANDMLKLAVDRLRTATEAKESGTFCRCPNCQFPFILPD